MVLYNTLDNRYIVTCPSDFLFLTKNDTWMNSIFSIIIYSCQWLRGDSTLSKGLSYISIPKAHSRLSHLGPILQMP